MKKKGFTLIELLAVIVILAIIALIATPVILNIIEDAKYSALKSSIDHYLSGLEITIANKNLKGTFNPLSCEIQNSILNCEGEELTVAEGKIPEEGTIIFNNGKVISYYLIVDGEEFVYGNAPESCFVSVVPGEINYYRYSEECPRFVIIPNDLKLPVSDVVDVKTDDKRCREVAAYMSEDENDDNPCDEVEVADLTQIFPTEEGKNYIEQIRETMSAVIQLPQDSEYNLDNVLVIGLIGATNYAFKYEFQIVDETKYPITKIGNAAFAISNIDGVYVSDDIEEIGLGAFEINKIDTLRLGKKVKDIGGMAFVKNNIKTLNMPNSLERVGWYSFSENKIEKIKFSNKLTKIEEYTFEKSNITEIEIPDNVVSIGKNAFNLCSNLTKVKFNNKLKTIGEGAFRETNLKEVNIPDSVEAIEINAFLGSNIETLNLGNGITSIGEGAFQRNKFTSITIPETLNYLPVNSFYENPNLTSITIEGRNRSEVFTMHDYAIDSSSSITELILNAPVNKVSITNSNLHWYNNNNCRMSTDGDYTTSSCITIN